MVLRIRSLKELGKNVRLAEGPSTKRRTVRIPRAASVPQQKLWQLVRSAYPDAEQDKRGLVPGRRFEADIVIERLKLVIEIDGWAFHGRFKKDFIRDRQKDRLLLINGYRTIRVTAGEILKQPGMVMKTINQVVSVIEKEWSKRDG